MHVPLDLFLGMALLTLVYTAVLTQTHGKNLAMTIEIYNAVFNGYVAFILSKLTIKYMYFFAITSMSQ